MTTQVEIVRPKRTPREWLAMLLADWLVLVPSMSGFAMLLLGACHHEITHGVPAFGYLQTLLGLYTTRLIVQFVTPWDAYKIWTREGK